jgi:hypothetical protein
MNPPLAPYHAGAADAERPEMEHATKAAAISSRRLLGNFFCISPAILIPLNPDFAAWEFIRHALARQAPRSI